MCSTSYLQSLLDKGGNVTVPAGDYLICDTLWIGSNTCLHCEDGVRIRLADGANCPMLRNKVPEENAHTVSVTVDGGVWDGNNIAQERAKYAKKAIDGDLMHGQMMIFTGTEQLRIRNLTLKDPESYGIQLTDTTDFTVENITFDYNDHTLNEDGLHVNGYAKDGLIRNLRGHTNDDLVALNADEGFFTGTGNDIENIVIDGIWGGNDGYTAIRLLSRAAHLRHISIRNIYGQFKYHIVSFTHWADEPGNYGFFDGIMIENIHASTCRKKDGFKALIWFQPDVSHVGTVVIRDYFRLEEEDYQNTTPLIGIGDRVHIKRLILHDIFDDVPVDKPTLVKGTDSKIDTFICDESIRM